MVKKETGRAYEKVIDYIKKKIMGGDLRQGEKLLPERELAEKLGISRNSVREALRTLENIGHFKARELLLVGGGSRNVLWNQIKANMLDIPIKVLDDAETTVSGAAMYAWSGAGEFASAGQARSQVHYQYRYFYPQTEPELSEGV